MDDIKALEMIITAGYSSISNNSSVCQYLKSRKDVRTKDVFSWLKNTFARREGVNPHKFDKRFFSGTTAGISAKIFQDHVNRIYYDGWILKVSPEGRIIEKERKEVAAEKSAATKLLKELSIQERIEEAVRNALDVRALKDFEEQGEVRKEVTKTVMVRRRKAV